MKILVTGGSGYIGSTLVPMLLDRGDSVTVVDNFMFGQTSLSHVCHNPKLTIIAGDVRDESLIKREVPKHDALLTLAAWVGAPLCNRDPKVAEEVNVKAIKMVHKYKTNNQMMIYPCTNSGYGIGQDGIFCDENTPLNPISHYGVQKVEAEKYLLDSGEALTFRFATLFGMSPRMRLDLLVNDFTYRAINDKAIVLFESHFKRNYLHVRDASKAFIHAIDNYAKMKGKPYNVGLSDANLSKRELCEVIKKQIPDFVFIESEIGEDPDKRNYIVSNARIESTGYKTDWSLDAGVSELLKGFKFLKRNQYANV